MRYYVLLTGVNTLIAMWNTFRDAQVTLVIRGLVTRETLKPEEFDDLMEKIHKANPKADIAPELLA